MNIYNQIIKEQADKIREKMKNGRLYGEPIDPENPDAVLVAAYMIGLGMKSTTTTSDLMNIE